MGIAKRNRPVGCLGDEDMDRPAFVFRLFTRHAGPECVQRFADSEGLVEAQGQSSGQRRAQLPTVWLGRSAHHLQLAAGEAAFREDLRV